jgi:hypothetical protein
MTFPYTNTPHGNLFGIIVPALIDTLIVNG